MKRRSSVPIALIFALSGSARLAAAQHPTTPPARPAESTPFFSASPLPYQAPPFDRIKESDYAPALEEGMKRQLAEIDAIANNPEPPAFDNTLEALERGGELEPRAAKVSFTLTQSNTSKTMQKIKAGEGPKLAAHQ